MTSSNQGGEVVTDVLCRTEKQVRRPDIAYITAKLIEQVGAFTVLPQSFPLIAEVASPEDSAEVLFAKAVEYIQSGCQEVWLLFPDQLVLVRTSQEWRLLTTGEVIETQTVLKGFNVAVNELLA